MSQHTTQVREVMEVYPRRRIICRYAACACGWRGEERKDAALADEDAARHRRFAPRAVYGVPFDKIHPFVRGGSGG